MIDLVTVVFRDELEVLKLQARSIELYCRNMTLGNILVVINDDTMSKDDIDLTWYGQLAGLVKIIHRQEFGTDYIDNGWVTQQLCKLLATAGITFSKWAMVLDAKTIFVQPVLRERLFDSNNRLTWHHYPMFSAFEPASKVVRELFNIPQKTIAGPAGVPFVFETALVRDMIQEVEHRTQQSFAEWFQTVGRVTEFVLYSGYLEYLDGSLDHRYGWSKDNYAPCNICHSEAGDFDRKFQIMHDPGTLTVSIHRNAWQQLTLEQQQQYLDFLVTRGIK